MGVRSAVALEAGVDDELLAMVDDYEHSLLNPAQKAALRFADAFLRGPTPIDDELRTELLRHLSSSELGALAVRLMHFSTDKVMVALGLDLSEVRHQIM